MTRYEHANKTSVTGATLRSGLARLLTNAGFRPGPSGSLALIRIFGWVAAIVVALGYYSHVRAQEGNHPGLMRVPLRPVAPLSSVPVPPVFGIEGILADKSAAIQLGKALFWDMQAGSDDTQACASCHFNAGADSRPANTVNPGQAGGDNTFQMGPQVNGSMGPNYVPNAGSANAGFGGYHDGDFPFHKLANVNDRMSVLGDVNDVAGSQGVFATSMGQVIVGRVDNTGQVAPGTGNGSSRVSGFEDGADDAPGATRHPHGVNLPSPGKKVPGGRTTSTSGSNARVGTTPGSVTSIETGVSTPDPVFSYPDPADPSKLINTRKVTGRNTPSVVDAVFNARNFWDGRAQNVCNGSNPFGARDNSTHLVVINATDGKLSSAFVSMKNSALCSQSLGPILSSVEMSADGRDFRQVGKKLLARMPLAKQMVDPTDSVLGKLSSAPNKGINTSYAALIQKAFQPEWWQFADHLCVAADGSITGTIDPAVSSCGAGTQEYSEMEYNFSLFWGVALQMYESTLIADQTPFDKYLEQQQNYILVGDSRQQRFTIQLQPNVDPFTLSVIELNPNNDFSDSDVYAFDNGYGAVQGEGLTQATIDYSSGALNVFFDIPPKAAFPIKISYSVGATPLTQAQLRGFLLFQTKARCVVCHGGPELSNAAVATVSQNPLERMVMGDLGVRVYDTGYYHIGVRPGAEDAGLAGGDPVANMPLSDGELMRQRVCNDPSLTIMIPGRPGDGISQAPLRCNDDIARTGFFKAPQLRNVALTAPYFHNGSQLTLEQVVEFYNRGGDFNQGTELSIMDPDIERLGLTLQEKQDLVDFLRTGLTDQRTLLQSAPFDHPELILANGHAVASNGYPVQSDPQHTGQAIDNYMHLPATGKSGGKPMPTYLENLVGVKNARPN
jgi:cytochrome c peroxidase